jgi:proteasome assembly chaperone (PAC2) family protein
VPGDRAIAAVELAVPRHTVVVTPNVEFESRPELSRPVVLCAFAGWNDGGEAATTAARYVRDRWGARRFATIDPEEFFDFQVNRPTVELRDGQARRLEWPSCEFSHASAAGRDVVVFVGVEPNNRWRTFVRAILDVVREVDASLLLTLGAFLADVPHTRPAPVSAASTDARWIGRLGIAPSRYEGPTGIVGVLHEAARAVGVPTVSLWGAAPHYLPSGTNPKVALSLLLKLEELLEMPIDTDDVQTAVSIWEKQVQEAVEQDENLVAYVSRLEEAAREEGSLGQIPSGDQLAEELERFLRDHPGGEGPGR